MPPSLFNIRNTQAAHAARALRASHRYQRTANNEQLPTAKSPSCVAPCQLSLVTCHLPLGTLAHLAGLAHWLIGFSLYSVFCILSSSYRGSRGSSEGSTWGSNLRPSAGGNCPSKTGPGRPGVAGVATWTHHLLHSRSRVPCLSSLVRCSLWVVRCQLPPVTRLLVPLAHWHTPSIG